MKDEPLREPVAALLRRYFNPHFYLNSYADVKKAGADPLEHYLEFGWSEGRAPNSWFDPELYARHTYEFDPEKQNPFLHLLERAIVLRSDPKALYSNSDIALLRHVGADGKVVSVRKPEREVADAVRPHFDADYYVTRYPEVETAGVDPLMHYMMVGWIEGRDPSPDFSTSFYLKHNKDVRQAAIEPYHHYLTRGYKDKWRQSASVEGAAILSRFADTEDMGKYVEEALELEPMIGFPRQGRRHTVPNALNNGLYQAAKAMRREFQGRQYKYIVAVPHIRMSGAARVAAILTDMLSKSIDPNDILVVITDSSETPYEQWFPQSVSRFDLSPLLKDMSEDFRARALLDLMRGVHCETLINVNSRLVWDTMIVFGRQMSQEFQLATYLFTWDETPEGRRGGYPIQWLRDTADFHHLIFTDTANLARDISDRFGYDETIVRTLYTPVEAPQCAATPPAPADPPRFLWAGRFDRQKRVDVLVEIAHANPHVTFDVYGKAVLDSGGLESFKPPVNINALGTYDSLEEVLETPYHGFVYTAQWDGLPTVLLDMALAGLPLVAPSVGGIAELVDEKTGWLVPDCEDVDGYTDALTEMVAKPEEAALRVDQMKARVNEMFSPQNYVSELKKALKFQ